MLHFDCETPSMRGRLRNLLEFVGGATVTESRSTEENDGSPAICPFCGSDQTEPHALFGSLMLMEQHYCRACRTVFERIRDDEPPAPSGRNKSG
jgi:hypothetical protein